MPMRVEEQLAGIDIMERDTVDKWEPGLVSMLLSSSWTDAFNDGKSAPRPVDLKASRVVVRDVYAHEPGSRKICGV